MMMQWQEILAIAGSIVFSTSEDQLIWQYESKGVYSSSSMYSLVNFRGVRQIFLPTVWKLKIPPRIQVFLWLFSQNKIMTRDNLRARGIPKPLECEMCKEIETVKHLFSECIVARELWQDFFEIFGVQITDFESVASKWICNKSFMHFNVVSSAILWTIWNNRNNLVFDKVTWINMKQVWRLVLLYLRNWKIPFRDLESGKTAQFMELLISRLMSPLRLQLIPDHAPTSAGSLHG